MNYSIEVISNKLKSLRKESGKTQKEVANYLNVTTKQISSYENQVLIPPMETLLKYCELFDCELGYILGESDYSDKTRINTLICNNLGISLETAEIIKQLTGKTEGFLFSFYESEFYQNTINEILTSELFPKFFEQILEVAEIYHNLGKNSEIAKKQLDDELYSQAINLYLHGNLNEEPSKEIIDAAHTIANADSKDTDYYNHFISSRYKLHVISEKLVDSIYPINF